MFLNEEHRKTFESTIRSLTAASAKGECADDIMLPLFILSAMPDVLPRLLPYVNPDYIDFQAMYGNIMLSTGETLMTDLAAHLYNGGAPANINCIRYGCDLTMQKVASEAIRMAFQRTPVSEFGDQHGTEHKLSRAEMNTIHDQYERLLLQDSVEGHIAGSYPDYAIALDEADTDYNEFVRIATDFAYEEKENGIDEDAAVTNGIIHAEMATGASLG